MTDRPNTSHWARWWIGLWAIVAVILLALLPFIGFGLWAGMATVGFGLMEGIGTFKDDDRYPPLTHVIREYLPRQITLAGIGFFVGVAGGTWFHVQHPFGLGALMGIYSWFMAHFDSNFDEMGKR